LSQYFLPPGQPQDNFPADDEEVLRARSKLVDIVRNLKCDTLKKFDSHIAQVMVDHPELGTMSSLNVSTSRYMALCATTGLSSDSLES
jgi:hypothetical protein